MLSLKNVLLQFVILFYLGSLTSAQDQKPLSDAGTATCEYPQSAGLGAWVSSPAGFAAAVEIRTAVSGREDQRHCTTAWILHVRSKDEKSSDLTVAEREDVPEDPEWVQENSFEIVEWSHDGSMLLATQIQVQGDWDESTPIVYDFHSSTYWRVPLHPIFAKLIPPGCPVVFRPLRFQESDSILIAAMSTEEDLAPQTKRCFATSTWKLNFRQNTISSTHP